MVFSKPLKRKSLLGLDPFLVLLFPFCFIEFLIDSRLERQRVWFGSEMLYFGGLECACCWLGLGFFNWPGWELAFDG